MLIKATQLLDHHMHSEFSDDSEQDMEILVKNAISGNKKFITFTEHSDIINHYIEGDLKDRFCCDNLGYDNKITTLQKKYPEITLLRGTEIGFEETIISEVQKFIDTHKFDITILSIHSLHGGKDMAYEIRTHGKWLYSDTETLLKEYFLANLKAVQTINDFQILGHLDYLLRYIENGSSLDISRYNEIFVAIFDELKKKDAALDLNTAGIRYGLPFAHPQPHLLKLYKDVGGKNITLGSDAHFAKDVNFAFKEMTELLMSIGFTSITTYENGFPSNINIKDII